MIRLYLPVFPAMVLSVLLSGTALAGGDGRPVRLTNGEFPPYLSESEAGYGVASKIVSEAFARTGHQVDYGFFPWKRALVLAELGEWDGTVVWSWSAERDRSFLYSKPVIVTREVFFHRRTLDLNWHDYADLKDYRIGATIGYFYGEAFQKAEESGLIQVDRIATDYHNLRKLANGRIDLSLVEINVGRALLKNRLPETADQITADAGHPTRVTTLHLLISRTLADGPALIAAFDHALAGMRAEGRVDQLFDRAGLARHQAE